VNDDRNNNRRIAKYVGVLLVAYLVLATSLLTMSSKHTPILGPFPAAAFTATATSTATATGTPTALPTPGAIPHVSGEHRETVYASSNTAVSNSVASFMPISGVITFVAASVEGEVWEIQPIAGDAVNLFADSMTTGGALTAPGAATSYAIALNDISALTGLSSTVLTCTISGATATSCSDQTHIQYIGPGDILFYSVTPTGSPTATVIAVSMEIDL